MKKTKSLSPTFLYLITAATTVLWASIDQLSKAWIVEAYGDGDMTNLGIIIIRLVWNPGIAFSLPLPTPVLLFFVVGLVLYMAKQIIPQLNSRLVAMIFGFILGGAIGNIIDRFLHNGAVVDFIDLNFWPLKTFPVFNIADIGISCGVVALIGVMFWYEKQRLADVPEGADVETEEE